MKPSHKIKINNNTAIKEIVDPIEEITFQVKKASGKSEYRRGIPLNPRKCWGKKVMFTPINITINWIFKNFSFIVIPVNKGNQWTKPAIIAKTAPIERT